MNLAPSNKNNNNLLIKINEKLNDLSTRPEYNLINDTAIIEKAREIYKEEEDKTLKEMVESIHTEMLAIQDGWSSQDDLLCEINSDTNHTKEQILSQNTHSRDHLLGKISELKQEIGVIKEFISTDDSKDYLSGAINLLSTKVNNIAGSHELQIQSLAQNTDTSRTEVLNTLDSISLKIPTTPHTNIEENIELTNQIDELQENIKSTNKIISRIERFLTKLPLHTTF